MADDKKFNNLAVIFGWQMLVFENLNPQEIGQITHLIAKATPCETRYTNGKDFYERNPDKEIRVEIIKSDRIVDPAPPTPPEVPEDTTEAEDI